MKRTWIALVGLALGLSTGIRAQTLAGIIGEVRDASGAIAPDVKVVATNMATNVARETVTNETGLYTFPSLVPGMYSIKVEASGFQPMQRNNVELQVQQTARVDFTLVVGATSQTVEVSGARVHLTGKEYQMLELLSLRKGTTLTKEMFLNHLYGGMDEPELKIIDVFICKLRKKLANASSGKNYIETVWGRGYVLREPADDEARIPA